MSEQQYQEHGDTVWSKISKLEMETAAIKSDIRGLFAGLNEIRDVLVRMQENNRPNVNGLLIGGLALASFLVTIGGLTVTPIWRSIGDHEQDLLQLDARIYQTEKEISERIYRNEDLLLEQGRDQARLQGMLEQLRREAE